MMLNSSSSEEDMWPMFESSDDELLDFPHRKRPKNENYLETTVPKYNDKEFMEHFRLSKEMAVELAGRFKSSLYYTYQAGGNGKIDELQHVLIFLWFAGHQTASFRDVADRFDITISTLHTILKRMVYFLSNLSSEIIKWPSAAEKIVIEGHFRDNGFPGVIGAVDGTHIKIDKPKNDPDSYLNRKHYFSIQVRNCYNTKYKLLITYKFNFIDAVCL